MNLEVKLESMLNELKGLMEDYLKDDTLDNNYNMLMESLIDSLEENIEVNSLMAWTVLLNNMLVSVSNCLWEEQNTDNSFYKWYSDVFDVKVTGLLNSLI